MKRIYAILRLVFSFSKTESNAFLVLLPLMLIVITAEPIYQTYFVSNKPDDFSHRKEIDSLIAVWKVPEKKKVFFQAKPVKKFSPKKQKQQKPKFDLNLADTTELKSIYGIGTTLARRIVTYRSNLGGFIAFNQLYEVWGLDSTVVVRLAEKTVIAPGFTPDKLAINRCSEQELARHPYLRNKVARAIVNYRLQHGNFVTIDDLRKINIIEEKIFLRIEPYITLD